MGHIVKCQTGAPGICGTPSRCVGVDLQEYATAQSMMADPCLKVGYAHTLGFYEVGDGGEAYYTVVAQATGDAPNGMDVLKCRTYIAKLIISGYMTPKQYGAAGDGTLDDSLALQQCFNSGSVFLDGDYLIKRRISIKDIDIIGNGSTIRLCASDFDFGSSLFAIFTEGADGNIDNSNIDSFYKINIDNVNFIGMPSSLSNTSRTVIALSNTIGASITNCRFTSEQSGNISPIELRGGNIDTTIEGCFFNILTDNGTDSSGSIPIRSYNSLTPSRGIFISNCTFTKRNVDEFIIVTTNNTNPISDIIISGCQFTTYTPSHGGMDYAITASGNNDANVTIANCNFNFNQLNMSVFSNTPSGDADITFLVTGCTINMESGCSSTLARNCNIKNSIIIDKGLSHNSYAFFINCYSYNNTITIEGPVTAILQNSTDNGSHIVSNGTITYCLVNSNMSGSTVEMNKVTQVVSQGTVIGCNFTTDNGVSNTGTIIGNVYNCNTRVSGADSLFNNNTVNGSLTSYNIEHRINFNTAQSLVGNIDATKNSIIASN